MKKMVLTFLLQLTSVYVNNHVSVYGSWYRDGRWGYACCHQFHKNSYCTGAAGVKADEEASGIARGEIEDMPPPRIPKKHQTKPTTTVDNGQLRDAIKDRTKRKRPNDESFQLGKRALTVAESAIISEEEYEDYRRNKMTRGNDPLNAMQKFDGTM